MKKHTNSYATSWGSTSDDSIQAKPTADHLPLYYALSIFSIFFATFCFLAIRKYLHRKKHTIQ